MADLIHNVQEVYKKWESKASHSSRGRRRDLQDTSWTRQSYGRRNNPYSNYSSYNRPGERRFSQRTRTPYLKLPKYDGLAQFKMAPCVVAENKPRPFMGSCCSKCLPMSRATIADKSVFMLSVGNILHIPHLYRLDFSVILNALKQNQQPLYPEILLNVHQSERVVKAVEDTIEILTERNDLNGESVNVLKGFQYTRAKHILESLKTSISAICLQISCFFLQFILSKSLDGILVHKGQIEILKTVTQENVPILYIPVLHCQLDYLLVSFVLYMNSSKVPLVVTDSDLYIPVLGYFTKFLGAIYIQKFLKDIIETRVVHEYLKECLKAGHNLEFFLEGGRSRSGKPTLPDISLLANILDSVVEGTIDDVLISTVSISYEKVTEGNFVSEQLGQPRIKETTFSKLCSFWRILHFNFGNVRLNFGQPFSIKEFIQTHQKTHPTSAPLNTYTPPDSPSSCNGSNFMQQGSGNAQLKSVTHFLAQHIIHDATASTALMSTQLVAFLLVTQYRKGATQQQLQTSLDWLRGELLNKKRDTGFTGESLPVIKRAVELLGKQLIVTETIDMEWTSSDMENNNVKITLYKPAIKLPHILELQYYANSVVPVFLLDSMIVNAVYALVDVEICHFRHCDSKLFVLRDKLIDKAVELNEMLQFEFLAVPPCADLVFSLSDILDELIEKDCLHVAGVGILSGRANYSGKSHALCFESSDEDADSDEEAHVLKEQQLKIDLTEESINHLEFLRNILSPYIESYWLAAITLLKLLDEITEENMFIQEMQLTAQEKLYKGLLAYEESFSAETFKNAIKLFECWHVIESYLQDGIKIVYLNDSFNSKERINDIIARIEEFRK